jgi:hypothetical protein
MVTNPKIILLLMTQKKLPKKFLGPGKEELKEMYIRFQLMKNRFGLYIISNKTKI